MLPVYGEELAQALHRPANTVDAHRAIHLEFGLAFVPERRHRNVMSACGEARAQAGDVALYPAHDGRIKLGQKKNAHEPESLLPEMNGDEQR